MSLEAGALSLLWARAAARRRHDVVMVCIANKRRWSWATVTKVIEDRDRLDLVARLLDLDAGLRDLRRELEREAMVRARTAEHLALLRAEAAWRAFANDEEARLRAGEK